MATFQGASFLEAQLKSIVDQTRPPDEIVISDDGSSDGTTEIVASFDFPSTTHVRVIENTERVGSTANFERAVRACAGDVIFLADQDDVWMPHKIDTVMRTLRSGVDAAFTDAIVVGPDLRRVHDSLWRTVGFSERDLSAWRSGDAIDVLLRKEVVTGTTLAFRASQIDTVIPFPTEWVQDGWIALLIASLGRIEPIDEPLVLYRQHPGNLIGVGPQGITRRLLASARADRKRFQSGARRYEIAQQRLSSKGASDEILTKLEGKTKHLDFRAGLPSRVYRRVPMVLRELPAYRRYSRQGGVSAFRDAIL
jgi:glycosyltransferase involved in cell wall biosynthesis